MRSSHKPNMKNYGIFLFLIQFFFKVISLFLTIYVRIAHYFRPTAYDTSKYSHTQIIIDANKPVAEASKMYLSFALDSAEVFGGFRWDVTNIKHENKRRKVRPLALQQKKLINLTKALHPAYLRIGGTEADRIVFDDKKYGEKALLLTRKKWDEVNLFAQKTGLKLYFTVNAGYLERDKNGVWQGTNFEK
ncbi:MAG: hypothetical protein KGJ07_00885, partial [Patescibacteria group bacterium]|nr:hypothetical protein [Patescibacteria group bacterium]